MVATRITEACVQGQFTKSRELLEDCTLQLELQDRRESAAGQLAFQDWREAVVGNREMAERFARRAIEKQEAGIETRMVGASVLASVGELELSRQIAEEISREYPNGTLVQELYLPTIRALEALWSGNPGLAMERLHPTLRFGSMPAGNGPGVPLLANYERGLALLALEHPEKAASEFHEILDNRGQSLAFHHIEYPAAFVGLARA
jgi:hypothetical protein